MKNKDKQEQIILADGCLVMGGPWINPNFMRSLGDGGFSVDISVIKPGLLKEEEKHPSVNYRYRLHILDVKIATNYHTVSLPKIKCFEEGLWTKDLAKAVAMAIKESRECSGRRQMVDYVVGKITGRFEKEKEMPLNDGRILVGDLSFVSEWDEDELMGSEYLRVIGKIKEGSSGATENATLLTIKHLFHNRWPGPDKRVRSIKNKELWCKKLEILVISYLNMLADFNDNFFCEQIGKIAQSLTDRSEWSVAVHQLMQKLLILDSNARDDERVKQIFALAGELNAGN